MLPGAAYAAEFQAVSAGGFRRNLTEAVRLLALRVKLTRLPFGNWSSQSYWYPHADAFVNTLDGER
jgi:uncharacterized cupin superfamily protein